jgi:adenosylmethionine---8-amino-7-oxononanoate aminotransferase
MEITALGERDRRSIWHPFTQMLNAPLPIPIKRGEGAFLIGEDGKQYLDAFSSWWVNLHGHSHPYLIESLLKQAKELQHVAFTDFTHQPAVELAERVLSILPENLSKIFYSDNGSTAIETALKMTFQYWHNKNPQTTKRGLVSFKNGYHGDTFGAMAAAGKGTFNQPFWPFLFDIIPIDPPIRGEEERSLKQLSEASRQHDLAGFIFEPAIQGAGGMKIHSLHGLDALIAYCKQYGIITIADEVMTGFGRTGPLFVSSQLKNCPDIICLAKGLTGGLLPLAITACTEKIYQAFLSHEGNKTFLHGHTYAANPLSCAVALGSLDLLQRAECSSQRRAIERSHEQFCKKWNNHPKIRRLEYLGTILILEYQIVEDGCYFHPLGERLKQFFLERQILVRPFGPLLHLMPPYCIENGDLMRIYHEIIYTLENAI